MKKLLSFISVLILALGCGRTETSENKIVNGYVESPEMFSDDTRGLSFVLGFHLGDKKTRIFSEGFCSGFRYGYQTLITAAHCIEAQYPNFRENSPVIELTTGTGKPLVDSTEPVEIQVHPDYSTNCLKNGGMCPDIAVIKLPDSIASLDIWINGTDPAEIDLTNAGFPKGEAPILAGFGCTVDDFYLSGECSRATFKDLQYSIATGLVQRPMGRQDLGPYYFQVDGKNSIQQSFGIGSGDSGAPLFRKLPQQKTLRPGDTKRAIVDGIGIYVDSGFVTSLGYDNLILDFAHPKVATWLLKATANDGASFKGPTRPVINPGSRGLCNPDLISSKPADKPFNSKTWTVASLGGSVPEEVVTLLNGLRNGRTNLYLGMCIGYVEKKINELEKIGPSHPSYEDLTILYQVARWELLMLLEIAHNSQQLDDQQIEILERLHKLQVEFWLDMQDTVLSGTPLVSTAYDLYILWNRADIKGPVSDFEYNLTATMFLVPGIIKATGPALQTSAKTLEVSAKYAESIGRYGVKAGKFSVALSNSAKQVRTAHSSYMALINTAKSMGIETVEGIRSLLRLKRYLEPACNLAFHDNLRQNPTGIMELLKAPLWLIEGRAYASESCGQLTFEVAKSIIRAFPDVAEESIDAAVIQLKKFCSDGCDLSEFIGQLSKLTLGEQFKKVVLSIESSSLKSAADIIDAFKTAYSPHNIPKERSMSQFHVSGNTDDFEQALKLYDEILDSLIDTAAISRNLGIKLPILKKVKKHFFMSRHRAFIRADQDEAQLKYFEPIGHFAELWKKATTGSLDESERDLFFRFIAHEYVESGLIDKGLPFNVKGGFRPDGDYFPTPTAFGAHDLAPNVYNSDPFHGWSTLLQLPSSGLHVKADLSNLDELIELIHVRVK